MMSLVSIALDAATLVGGGLDGAALRAGAAELGAVCCDPGVRRLARQIEEGALAWNDLRQPRWYELALLLAAWLPVKAVEQLDLSRPAWMPPWAALFWYVERPFDRLVEEARVHPYVRKKLYPVERYALVAPYVTRTLALRLAERANECACGARAYMAVVFDHEQGSHTPSCVEWMCDGCAAEVDRLARVIPLAGEWDRVFGKFGSRMVESQLEVGRGRAGLALYGPGDPCAPEERRVGEAGEFHPGGCV